MTARDPIVIGASAGGVEALAALAAGLPPDLADAVCVVVHQRPRPESRPAQVLRHAGPLPAASARDGPPRARRAIVVAVPDCHLLVEGGTDGEVGVVRLARGPRANRARPAVDPLFRSAALAFGPRVIGVICSGALHDRPHQQHGRPGVPASRRASPAPTAGAFRGAPTSPARCACGARRATPTPPRRSPTSGSRRPRARGGPRGAPSRTASRRRGRGLPDHARRFLSQAAARRHATARRALLRLDARPEARLDAPEAAGGAPAW
ncbi:chemotaxis protein CheB [Roseisolibacter sp. H3M3-2]|uniref:chemotaxis protein CheB n=1 Tax=Roseisolibacter sp. H3M3-2 TaxID=3031323 RepID=UPI0031F31ABF